MTPTRAMVLAAGLGTRMRPLTTLAPKPILPVANRPLLGHVLEHLASHGVTLAVVNAHHMPEALEESARRSAPASMEVVVSRERRILGTAGGLRKAAAHFRSETFYLVNGDSLTDADLTGAARAHAASGRAATMIVRPHDPAAGYRPVKVVRGGRSPGRVCGMAGRRWGRGPSRPYTFTGIHVIEPSVLRRIPAGVSDIVADVYTSLLDEDGDAVGAWVHRGWWFEAGSPERYLELNLALLRRRGRRVVVAPGFFVDEEAQLDRCALGVGARIERGARLADCVLWDGVHVREGVNLRRCVVTSGVDLPPSGSWRDRILMSDGGGGVVEHPLRKPAVSSRSRR